MYKILSLWRLWTGMLIKRKGGWGGTSRGCQCALVLIVLWCVYVCVCVFSVHADGRQTVSVWEEDKVSPMYHGVSL